MKHCLESVGRRKGRINRPSHHNNKATQQRCNNIVTARTRQVKMTHGRTCAHTDAHGITRVTHGNTRGHMCTHGNTCAHACGR